MPAPEIAPHSQDNGKTLGHVNLMVDTLIANATIDEQVLRAITRSLLATGTPSLAASFTAAARSRLRQTVAKRIATTNGLFATGLDGIYAVPTPELENVLARARSLYGAGMGFTSLALLSSVVKSTVGLRWEQDGLMADTLAVIDADISQAIQSCKEELEGGRVNDLSAARETISKMWAGVEESSRDVDVWGGEFPFDRAANSIECWRI
ncbi:hypothetical protein HYDPIDRAFT_28612 [Hydnomerulius pinastri MD-312]|uniref:Uncharacterized protein n=1 Tax=Hydnomerulius pinastri MD-312 TaxID=994086 RepID=A0A0C9W949_9AGAM|nr:hypothetical protein HYDPIDRAFT_28612 [Hydnomerulius pinastri MD-312]